MRIEKLSKGRKKKIVLVITILVLLIGIIYITNSKAKYHVTSSVQIVKGKVNYSLADLNVLALNVQSEKWSDKYNPTDEIPSGNYEINMQNSYCTIPGDNIEHKDIPMEYKDNGVYIKITKKGTKCYVYLDYEKTISERTLTNLKLKSQGDAGDITGPSCAGAKDSTCYSSGSDKNNMAQNGVFSAEDDFGTSFYFRGTVNNNWLKFGKEGDDDLWWRIIRVNGNGTIRLIYSGKGNTLSTTGTGTQIATTYSDGINQEYNTGYNDNTYVGFKYGSPNKSTHALTHQNNIKSTIMTELETWYVKTTLRDTSNLGKIDVETGFCNDRQTSVGPHGSYGINGWGSQSTAYAPWDRLIQSDTTTVATIQKPTFKCGYKNSSTDKTAQKRDLFTGPNATSGGTDGLNGKIEGNNALTYPVGLITSDEVIYAGGFFKQKNDSFWLYTHQIYWTISPFSYYTGSLANTFIVYSDGRPIDSYVSSEHGVRPVINLKADTKIEFQDPDGENKGTTSNPYIVQ